MMSAIARASFKETHQRRMLNPSIGLAGGHVVIALFFALSIPSSNPPHNRSAVQTVTIEQPNAYDW